MRVTSRQAFVIARSLQKGIKSGDPDVSFSVYNDGEATVGLRKKFDKYIIYITRNAKVDRAIKLPKLPKNADVQVIADQIQEALEESDFLQDIELDTSRKIFQDATEEELEEELIRTDNNGNVYDDLNSQIAELADGEGTGFEDDEGGEEEAPEPEEEPVEESQEDPEEDDAFENADEIGQGLEEDDGFEETDMDSDTIMGFDIFSYIGDYTLEGSVLDKSKRIATLIADAEIEEEKPLTGKERKPFIKLLDAIILACTYKELTREIAEPRVDSFYVKELNDFVINKEPEDIEAFFKELPQTHLALTPYKAYKYSDDATKLQVMQSLVLRLGNYATEEFNNIFTDIYNEFEEARTYEYEILEKGEEPEDMSKNNHYENVFDHDLENNEGPNPYYALDAEPKRNAVGEYKDASHLQKQINKRGEQFATGMTALFKEILQESPDQAEKLYLVTIAIALRANNGDTAALSEKVGLDERDIIMADYEYQIRKKEIHESM